MSGSPSPARRGSYEPHRAASTVDPTLIRWAAPSSTEPPIFFNIGRSPLARFDYLYDARCAQVGFFDRLTAR